MSRINQYIPRAIFYMDLKTPLYSLARILFSFNWKNSRKLLPHFKHELQNKFQFPGIYFTSHARIALFHILKFLNFSYYHNPLQAHRKLSIFIKGLWTYVRAPIFRSAISIPGLSPALSSSSISHAEISNRTPRGTRSSRVPSRTHRPPSCRRS